MGASEAGAAALRDSGHLPQLSHYGGLEPRKRGMAFRIAPETFNAPLS